MKTTPDERLEALIHYLRQTWYWQPSHESLIRWGYLVGGDNGDDHIAPKWMEEYRTAHGQNTEKG